MIIPMKKIKLIGLSSYEQNILNALHKTGCVQISETEEFSDTFSYSNEGEMGELSTKINRINKIIDFYQEIFYISQKKEYFPKNTQYLSNFIVSYEEFVKFSNKEKTALDNLEKIEKLNKDYLFYKAEIVKINNQILQLKPYFNVKCLFSDIVSTEHTQSVIGLIKKESLNGLLTFKKENTLFDFEILDNSENSVVLCVFSNVITDKTLTFLNECGFNKCTFDFNCTAKQKINELNKEIEKIEKEIDSIQKYVCKNADLLKDFKILYDYTKFILEKYGIDEKFKHTNKTFILEGFVPSGNEDAVKSELNKITNSMFIEFSEPDKNDNPPTLTVNNKVVRQSEFITDMYSTPNYNEIDPNKVVFGFFMVFMGIIMADIGYGVLMAIIGSILALRIKVDNGTRRLWWVIAFGGLFAIIFGFLFNSFFGISILPFRILPNPIPDENGADGLMIILLLCLGLGVLHISVGYLLKGLNAFKQKDYLSAIFDGFIWVLFFIGFIFATFNFLLNYLSPNSFNSLNQNVKGFFNKMTMPGIIVLGFSLLVAAIGSGRNEKGFGKLSKGFGTFYGLINIMSDILSYARLFGLMLSGMIIASTFNDIGASIVSSGGVGYIFGPIVIILGHTFNIAMGVLGAYIHDSRLQYIEFFGKFYSGDGNKFTPIGSDMNYIYLTK